MDKVNYLMRNVRHNRRLIRYADAHFLDRDFAHVCVPRNRNVVRQSGDFARFTFEISTSQWLEEGITQTDTRNDFDRGALLVG